MATHAGGLTATRPGGAVPARPDRRAAPHLRAGHDFNTGGRECSTASTSTSRRGEFVALLGRSGTGKSTLLRALAGLDRDVAGHGDDPVPEQVSVVFQDSRLLPWRRVLDNVTLGLRGRDADERGRAALGRGRPRRPRARLAARAVRRRAAARRAGPLAGPRPAAAAGRRAVRRARRADPDPDARAAARAVRPAPAGGAAGHPRRRRGDRARRPGDRARRRRGRADVGSSSPRRARPGRPRASRRCAPGCCAGSASRTPDRAATTAGADRMSRRPNSCTSTRS